MKLTTAQRKKIPNSQFAGPGRSYPIEDKAHARNAIARASQQENAGNLSPSRAASIKAKARAKLKGRPAAGSYMKAKARSSK